jgi:hypothetical protein
MEKRYFVLKKGYLNIDKDFFYFSSDGDWKNCYTFEETEKPVLTFWYMTDYLIKIMYIIIASAIVGSILFGEINISLFGFGLIIIFHFVNQYFTRKLFKIPLQKIDRLVLKEDYLTVHFQNRKRKMIKHTVQLDDDREIKDIRQYFQAHFQPKLNIA